MKVNREEFLNHLEAVKAGLSPREFIEQSSCFVFADGMVMTFNDEVACRKEIGLKITGAIQAASLLEILGKLTDEELKIRENEKGELEFLGKRKRFGITKDAEIFLPIDRVETPEKWKPLPKEFTEAVGLVQHCVSTDESRFVLCCVHLHPEYLEACDNLQIMRVKVATGLKSSILVRGTSLAHIVSLGMDEMAVTKSWVHFKNQNGLIFSCRLYREDFPNLDEQIKLKGHDITIPKGVKEASERAAVFASNKSGDPLVTVSLTTGMIEIKGEGLTGWYKERKGVSYEGPSMAFVIAPGLLMHISENHNEAKIGETKLKVNGGHWIYVTVLGKPGDAEEEEDKDDGKDES